MQVRRQKNTGEEANGRAQPLVFCNKDSRQFLVSPAQQWSRTPGISAIQRML
jgi:hypothetical protein